MTAHDLARIERRLDKQDEVLGEIRAGQQKLDVGQEKLASRTLKIELWQSRLSGALAFAAFLTPILAGWIVLH